MPFAVITPIALFVLLPLVMFCVETCAYLLHWRWYFRLGPAFHREQWQTGVRAADAAAAVDAALPALVMLRCRRRGDSWTMRFRWWELSAWPRILLRVRDEPQGAILIYEVRPFLSMAAFIPLCIWAILIGFFRVIAAAVLVYIVGTYAVIWWWEMRRLRRLEPLHKRLSPIGLAICTNCGYDLHALPREAACPECGLERTAPVQTASAPDA